MNLDTNENFQFFIFPLNKMEVNSRKKKTQYNKNWSYGKLIRTIIKVRSGNQITLNPYGCSPILNWSVLLLVMIIHSNYFYYCIPPIA